jgi:hypothetical protein
LCNKGDAGIISSLKEGKTVQYFIKDPESLTDLLRNYFPTIWSSLSDKFAKLITQLLPLLKGSNYDQVKEYRDQMCVVLVFIINFICSIKVL